MMLYTVLTFVLVCGVSEVFGICKTDSDCGTGECCYIQPEFMVVSKRQAVLPQLHQHHDTGLCTKYRLRDEQCYPMETANGHCGCGAGLSCQWFPLPTAKRSMAYLGPDFQPGPGSYRCAPKV